MVDEWWLLGIREGNKDVGVDVQLSMELKKENKMEI